MFVTPGDSSVLQRRRPILLLVLSDVASERPIRLSFSSSPLPRASPFAASLVCAGFFYISYLVPLSVYCLVENTLYFNKTSWVDNEWKEKVMSANFYVLIWLMY